jgi:hypothetical protein
MKKVVKPVKRIATERLSSGIVRTQFGGAYDPVNYY